MRKRKSNKLEEISKEIHFYMSYATLSTYHTMMKVYNIDTPDDKREEAIELLSKMLTTAESVYDDLTDEQKQLTSQLAERMLNIVKN